MHNPITLRPPVAEDGAEIHRLVRECPPLDENSMYCNLLQVTHFADTAVIAELEGELVGFVTGYRPPGRENVMFVWQVAVAEKARGTGLASKMLDHIVARYPEVTMLETTVTPENIASARAFERFAEAHAASVKRSVLFSRAQHFNDEHDDEVLFQIGPLNQASTEQKIIQFETERTS